MRLVADGNKAQFRLNKETMKEFENVDNKDISEILFFLKKSVKLIKINFLKKDKSNTFSDIFFILLFLKRIFGFGLAIKLLLIFILKNMFVFKKNFLKKLFSVSLSKNDKYLNIFLLI